MFERAHDPARSDSVVAARFAQVINELNQTNGWGLDSVSCGRYCEALTALHPHGCAETLLGRVVVAYHLDHRLVRALADACQAEHEGAWLSWMPQVLAVLSHAGLAGLDDGSGDLEDLAQVARLELARSLPVYRYESRFSTWAFQVILRSARNELRGRKALKRVGYTTYLDGSTALDVPIAETEHPESVAAARLLAALANSVLTGQGDARLARIFRLWALEDRRVVEIGAQVGLSPARVRVLLGQIVSLLQQDVRIRGWRSDDDDAGRD